MGAGCCNLNGPVSGQTRRFLVEPISSILSCLALSCLFLFVQEKAQRNPSLSPQMRVQHESLNINEFMRLTEALLLLPVFLRFPGQHTGIHLFPQMRVQHESKALLLTVFLRLPEQHTSSVSCHFSHLERRLV